VLTLQEDKFELKSVDIGKVLNITVGHSSVGRGKGWFCTGLQLLVGDSQNQLLFPCDRLVAAVCLSSMYNSCLIRSISVSV